MDTEMSAREYKPERIVQALNPRPLPGSRAESFEVRNSLRIGARGGSQSPWTGSPEATATHSELSPAGNDGVYSTYSQESLKCTHYLDKVFVEQHLHGRVRRRLLHDPRDQQLQHLLEQDGGGGLLSTKNEALEPKAMRSNHSVSYCTSW